jgi:hypothetical protein
MLMRCVWSVAAFAVLGLGADGDANCPAAVIPDGAAVVLRGEVSVTAHDLLLIPTGCQDRVIVVFGDDPSLGKPVPVKRDEQFQQFKTYLYAEKLAEAGTVCIGCFKYRVTAQLEGRLDVSQAAGWKRDNRTGKVIGIVGFGHPLPFARYRLVVSSVSQVETEDRPH